MAFGLDSFKHSQLGRQIGAIIENPQNVGDMIVSSRHGMPAVQAVGKELLTLGPEVKTDYVKKTVGRWIREIMESHGWVPANVPRPRVPPGHLCSSGMVYTPRKK